MGFSFHNAYREIGVQLGYPGMMSAVLVAAWAVFSTARTWLRNQNILNAAFVILAIAVVIRANTEIDLILEFSGTTVLMFIGAFRKEQLGPRPVSVQPPMPPQQPAPTQPQPAQPQP